MQALCKSDYQDVYRIKDGVLLVVNKFDYIYRKNGYRHRVNDCRKNSKTYENGSKDLKITIDKIESYDGEIIKAGQVLYHGYPVELVSKDRWDYQIKTTGDMFSGNSNEILKYIEEIVKVVKNNEK